MHPPYGRHTVENANAKWVRTYQMSRELLRQTLNLTSLLHTYLSPQLGGVMRTHDRTVIASVGLVQIQINAQRIGPLFQTEYLASEGPTMSSVFDFWCMVWQENVERILSVNFPHEERLYPSIYDPTKETIQYWPVEIGKTVAYMPFKITCMDTRMMVGSVCCGNLTIQVAPGIRAVAPNDMVYRVTQLRISYSNPIGEPEPDREIVHMCYYRWPDGCLPIPWPLTSASYAATAMRIIDIVERELPPSSSPMLVHCHAGLGRTGVFIALDVALRQLYQNNTVNIKGVVEKLREKRARAVMNPWQYAYINVVVAEK
ncbi:unnamed protein product, partial [Strongylus vulgaris]